ncbi:probable pectinesterase/pectinesterase inhibitor 21 [Quercus suber]|uniref:probable pectinesterase/pectinesterase inhibitor 21 n=1 Tax=Quercus suber TaxID=58331 RepID=UPI000CE20C48|nr:probable pectinesterase/pectinesterase inhibitor 21 [Quercus suber]POF05280.1 putative pectinesterase/pectinesterase inhibitor 21 [Quercus suber]
MTFGGYKDSSNPGHQKKKKIAIIGVSSVLLVAMVAAVAVGVTRNHGSSKTNGNANNGGDVSTSNKAIQTLCQPTDYRETCEKTLTSAAGNTSDYKALIKAGFQVGVEELNKAIANSTTLRELAKDSRTNQALENCKELIEYAIDDLQESFEKIGAFEYSKFDEYLADLKVWLSGSITYEQTCLDGFENTTGDAGTKMKQVLKTAQEITKNGLAMVTETTQLLSNLNIDSLSRRLLSNDDQRRLQEPADHWFSEGQRRLLAATVNSVKADVVVAKDGSGKYKTINEALKDIPLKSNKTFVIHIKAGVYAEHVLIEKSMTHVTFIGDGPTKTKITGSKNFVDGTPTFKTATVAVVGNYFFAKDIGFENTAGAEKHQAVALRVSSDMSVFFNCRMDGYQDTLYVHAHRQFYRDCTISGTIDFVFGNSATVFQNCTMIVRKPMDNQQCIVTAQGRTDRREPSALILQGCTIAAEPTYLAVKEINRAYLGRPWKEFSRTIIMQSTIGAFIQPEGWLPWMGNFGLNTCFYAEIGNKGPGSDQAKRVTWRGVKKITLDHAAKFTPGQFIGGDKWIKPTGVPYTPTLL